MITVLRHLVYFVVLIEFVNSDSGAGIETGGHIPSLDNNVDNNNETLICDADIGGCQCIWR